MSFIGEIDLFAFNFAPMNWAFCDGAAVPIRQYTQLFALIGTSYGGNGTTIFQLPNLSERAACGQGSGPGLTPRTLGETFGAAAWTLTAEEMPPHSHAWELQLGAKARADVPAPGSWLASTKPQGAIYQPIPSGQAPDTAFSPQTIGASGGFLPHENRQPYLAMTFGICMAGDTPSFG